MTTNPVRQELDRRIREKEGEVLAARDRAWAAGYTHKALKEFWALNDQCSELRAVRALYRVASHALPHVAAQCIKARDPGAVYVWADRFLQEHGEQAPPHWHAFVGSYLDAAIEEAS